MARLTVTVCDICERVDAPVSQYKLSQEGRSVTVELCAAHSEPLEALLRPSTAPSGTRTPVTPRKAPAKRRGGRVKVTTLAEIEKQKKTR